MSLKYSHMQGRCVGMRQHALNALHGIFGKGIIRALVVCEVFLNPPDSLPRGFLFVVIYAAALINATTSSTRHAVTRCPSFTGLGNLPHATPCHQSDLLTGMRAGMGGLALVSPMIWRRRRKPVSGSVFITHCLCLVKAIAGRQGQSCMRILLGSKWGN